MAVLPFYQYLKSTKKPYAKSFNPNPQTIGEHIRKKRIEAGLLQSDVAKILQTCEDSVTGWENGRSLPQVSLYPKIIRYLGYYPLDHPTETARGLIERCRHSLGLSYDNLGKLVGVHGTTLIAWAQDDVIQQPDCREKLLQLLNSTQSLLT